MSYSEQTKIYRSNKLSRLSCRAILFLVVALASFIFSVQVYGQNNLNDLTAAARKAHAEGKLASWYPLNSDGVPMHFGAALLVLAEQKLIETPALLNQLPLVEPNTQIGASEFIEIEVSQDDLIEIEKVGTYFWGFRFTIPMSRHGFTYSLYLSHSADPYNASGMVATRLNDKPPARLFHNDFDFRNAPAMFGYPEGKLFNNVIYGSHGVSRGGHQLVELKPGKEYAFLWVFNEREDLTSNPIVSINAFANQHLILSNMFTRPMNPDEYEQENEERLSSR